MSSWRAAGAACLLSALLIPPPARGDPKVQLSIQDDAKSAIVISDVTCADIPKFLSGEGLKKAAAEARQMMSCPNEEASAAEPMTSCEILRTCIETEGGGLPDVFPADPIIDLMEQQQLPQ